MTEIKLYKCDFCGKEYSMKERAKWCEDSHEKDLEISSAVYDSDDRKGMPGKIRVENKERTKLAMYRLIDVMERETE